MGKRWMSVKKWLGLKTVEDDPEWEPMETVVKRKMLQAIHIYAMELPHSYFLRKGPK